MKKLLIIVISFIPFLSIAQVGVGAGTGTNEGSTTSNDFFYGASGRQLFVKSTYDYTGSPYFGENYCSADIQVRKGKAYKGLKAKVNLQDNSVIYVDSLGVELVATAPIDLIRFYNCADESKNKTLISGLPKIDKLDESTFYIVVNPGNVALLKHIDVTYYDRQNNYGRASIVRSFQQNETYYLYSEKNGVMKLAKDNEALIKQLDSEKEKKLSVFVAQNGLKVKKEKDLVKLFAYYNSLP